MTNRTLATALGAVVAIVVVVFGILYARNVYQASAVVSHNVEARGGEDLWEGVTALRMTGLMDVGRGQRVPFTLTQKRPDKMCFEFVMGGKVAKQCTNGKTGWKVVPFKGIDEPVEMTEEELRGSIDMADPYGLLYGYSSRGSSVDVQGTETLDGRETTKVEVTTSHGAKRWVWVDNESGLELQMMSKRTIGDEEYEVITTFHDWAPTNGLMIARRHESRTVGDDQVHQLLVEGVTVNPPVDDSRFEMP